MLPKNYVNWAITLLFSSIILEITLLTKILIVENYVYHTIHIVFMMMLIVLLFVFFLKNKKDLSNRKYVIWMAVGMAFTTIGDYVNSAISPVNPVSLKLTWALLFFGVGYSIYVFSIWCCYRSSIKAVSNKNFERWYLLALPILVVNVISWFMHVQKYLYSFDLLHYGSFIFNITIYVLMPLGAIGIFRSSKYSNVGLLILFGSFLLPYSDLVLFATWLKGNPAVPSFEFYSYNWILYFSGQVLITLLPAWAMSTE